MRRHPFRVLIVEDVSAIARLSAEVARAFPGAPCRHARDERTFRAALVDFAPDLILYAPRGPRSAHLEALRLARELAPRTAFVLVAGLAERDAAAACLWAGADDYVSHNRLQDLRDVAALAIARRRHASTPMQMDTPDWPFPAPEPGPLPWQDVQRGLSAQQLRLHYHAMVSLTTGTVAAFEALVRFKHPTRGLLLPREFIPVAAETGLMAPIDRWVIREACRFARQLGEGSRGAAPSVSVNVSPQQFAQPDLADQVESILNETGVDGRRLRFEVTEGVLLRDLSAAGQKLTRLQEMGIAVDLDDFGTGFGSIACLRSLPIAAVKIDRSVIDRMRVEAKDRAIVRSVVLLAHRLGIATIAEGVHNQEDAEELGRIGCQYGQGFFFSKPMRAPDARGLLTRGLPAYGRDGRPFADPDGLAALMKLLDGLEATDSH
jgi:EAL domain-containing protein (putative c-di-GMP-specific phosphodiesterase class I)